MWGLRRLQRSRLTTTFCAMRLAQFGKLAFATSAAIADRTLDQRGRRSCPGPEAAKHTQIELAEPLRVAEDVDLGDLPASDREAYDRERVSFHYAEQPSDTVDEHWEPEEPEAREALRATSHFLRAADLDRSAQHSTGVDSEDHLWVEDSDEPAEVTVTRSCSKRIDNSSFNVHVGIRSGLPLPNTAACAAGQLASRIRGALDDRRDLLEGHVEDVVQHERDAFRRRKRLQHNEQGKADRVGQQCFVLRARSVRAVDDRIGQASLAPHLA